MIRQEVIQEKTALTGHDFLSPFGGNKSVRNLRHEKIGEATREARFAHWT